MVNVLQASLHFLTSKNVGLGDSEEASYGHSEFVLKATVTVGQPY